MSKAEGIENCMFSGNIQRSGGKVAISSVDDMRSGRILKKNLSFLEVAYASHKVRQGSVVRVHVGACLHVEEHVNSCKMKIGRNASDKVS